MEIVGISADPSANEDWTDQFGLPNDPVVASGLDGKSGLAPLGKKQNASPKRPDVVQKASGEKINGEWSHDGQNAMEVLNIDASSGWSDASMSEDEDEEDWDAESFYSATSKETKLSSTQNAGTNANEGFSLQLNILRKLVLEEDCAVNTLGAGTAEGLEVPACYKFLNKIERINKTGSLVYHPPASEALSIRSSDGFPRMNGQQLAKWLSDIVVSRVKLYNMQEVSDLGGQINRKGQKNQQGVESTCTTPTTTLHNRLSEVHSCYRRSKYGDALRGVLNISEDAAFVQELTAARKSKHHDVVHDLYRKCKALFIYGIKSTRILLSSSIEDVPPDGWGVALNELFI